MSTSIILVLSINKYLKLRYWNWFWEGKSALCVGMLKHTANSAQPWKYCIGLYNEQPHTRAAMIS